ncbi:putative DNA repair protein Nse1 [Sodiomyces alkalinus F11]|uniref:Non-structural maintenance of chromosomes element 1 homolog n=1 Tax=Sodiomyces alkalinus (strain CBS 110278 / VKM F-3762 / F11) TaxID=1314773 RepID=A0A3N2PY52_SODAK|nr:putative DNA repair protein Nse1 [Sodiomyces alkalinus F11]ROT39427.1 putative DNA repair protein Nse1 [Sodiomyces alkalinus F11]
MIPIPQDYNHGHRAFLQSFMGRGTLSYEDARPILAAIFTIEENEPVTPDQVTREDFDSYIEAASNAISFFDYEIRSTVHQVTKKPLFVLVNTTSDPMTRLATTYTAEEISFVRRMLDAMFDSYNTPRMEVMSLSEMDAIKLARPSPRRNNGEDVDGEGPDGTQARTQSTDRGLKHSEVEKMLAKLVGEGWLEKSAIGRYSLSPRALVELRTWLVDSFNDPEAAPGEWQRIKFCEACRSIVTHGQRCAERDCTVRLHDICEEAFWRTQRAKKCPRCSTEWTGQKFVGERAVTTTEAYQRARRNGHRRSQRGEADGNRDSGEDSDGRGEE